MQVALFFGSFNPIHLGHLIIGSSIADLPEVDQVWFVVSPQSPFKEKGSLLNAYDRLHLVREATSDDLRFRASSVEFSLPQPSYTIDTLTNLREQHPSHTFQLIVGSDTLPTLHKWKNHELLLRDYTFIVYPRPPATNPFPDHPNIRFTDFPFLNISSTYIRDLIKAGKSARYLLPERVYKYVDEMNLYR